MEQAVEQPELAQPSDHLLRNGLIWAVLIPIVGAIWAIRLFARERIGAGLAVLLTALVVIGIYILIVNPFGSGKSYSAYNATVQSEVEQTIRERIQNAGNEGTITELSCVAQSNSIMKCLAEISIQGEFGSSTDAQASYEVTIDQSNGQYIIGQPQVHTTEGSTP